MKVSAEGEQLRRVGKRLESEIVNGESIGMMVFNHSGAKAFVQKIESLMSSPGGLAQWYLSAIDELADTGIVGISSIQGFDWCEVDDLVDFEHAEKAVANWRNRSMEAGSSLSGRGRLKQQKAA
jgi:choline kinase